MLRTRRLVVVSFLSCLSASLVACQVFLSLDPDDQSSASGEGGANPSEAGPFSEAGGHPDSGVIVTPDGAVLARLQPGATIAVGAQHTCVIHGGKTYCWGNNSGTGAFGAKTTTQYLPVTESMLEVADPVEVVAANSFTCVRDGSGLVHCAGANATSQLGIAPPSYGSPTAVPVALPAGTRAVSICASYRENSRGHACAATSSGEVWCWGADEQRQLATANAEESTLPVKIAGVSNAGYVVCTQIRSCALTYDGAAYCWGAFGFETEDASSENPKPLASSEGSLVDLAVTEQRICGIVRSASGRRVVCWTDVNAPPVSPLPAILDAVRIVGVGASGSGGGPVCVIRASGELACIGNDRVMEIADLAFHGAGELALGPSTACALIPGLPLRCTLRNTSGEAWGLGLPSDGAPPPDYYFDGSFAEPPIP